MGGELYEEDCLHLDSGFVGTLGNEATVSHKSRPCRALSSLPCLCSPFPPLTLSQHH